MNTTKLLLGAAAIAITLGTVNAAHATNWGNNNGPTNNTTNNYNDNSTTNAPVANGGQGGQGGAGGNANQGQYQGQGQSQNATGGNAYAGSNSNSNAKSNSSSSSGAVSGSASGAYSGGNKQASSQNVTVEGDNYEAPEIPVSSAHSAALTSANGTCMGSTSVGGQGMAVGLSFGTTWMDKDCDRRYDAAQLKALGLPEAAAALMCQKPEVRDSMKRSLAPAKFAQLCGASEAEETVSYKSASTGKELRKCYPGEASGKYCRD